MMGAVHEKLSALIFFTLGYKFFLSFRISVTSPKTCSQQSGYNLKFWCEGACWPMLGDSNYITMNSMVRQIVKSPFKEEDLLIILPIINLPTRYS